MEENTVKDMDGGAGRRGISRLEEIDRQHEDELKAIDTNQPMTPAQTYIFTPLIGIVFFVAAYFSYGMQSTGESGWAQTFFLVFMGLLFFGYGAFNAYLRRKHAKKLRDLEEEKAKRGGLGG